MDYSEVRALAISLLSGSRSLQTLDPECARSEPMRRERTARNVLRDAGLGQLRKRKATSVLSREEGAAARTASGTAATIPLTPFTGT